MLTLASYALALACSGTAVAQQVDPSPVRAGVKEGTITLATAHPTIARAAYISGGSNGVAGLVVDLGAARPDGTPYEVRRLSGYGPVNLDAYFYSDLAGANGLGYACQVDPAIREEADGSESGKIVCGDSNLDGQTNAADRARFAVIVLRSGAQTKLQLTWG